jgi:hypothetical protein
MKRHCAASFDNPITSLARTISVDATIGSRALTVLRLMPAHIGFGCTGTSARFLAFENAAEIAAWNCFGRSTCLTHHAVFPPFLKN